MITLYGIKNCDTVKKARRWLEEHQIEYQFHDFREQGLNPEQVDAWLQELGWESLVNRRSTTWRELADSIRDSMDTASAQQQILLHPTLIKRPVLDTGDERELGFKAERYQSIFQQHTL